MGHTIVELGPDVDAIVQEIVTYAKVEKHWYRVSKEGEMISDKVPGDIPEHVLKSGTIRAVFSITQIKGKEKLLRYLTISNLTKLPSPVVVFTLPNMFGFTGAIEDNGVVTDPGKDWGLDINEAEGTIIVQQWIDKSEL